MIEFEHVTPAPLAGVTDFTSQIWNTSLQLVQGQNYLISAASGKGKSTFTGIIYGLRSDYEGKILIKGQDVRQQKLAWWAELRQQTISIVFQDLCLFLEFSAEENIRIKTQLHANSISQEKIVAMAQHLGVAHLLQKKCAYLSYGERQRIAIIRALSQPFEYLLLDEPFSHLDEANIALATQLIQAECKQRNAGWILTSLGDSYGLLYDNILRL
jgi:ABC-type lipoprotein export system ATPase subunit